MLLNVCCCLLMFFFCGTNVIVKCSIQCVVHCTNEVTLRAALWLTAAAAAAAAAAAPAAPAASSSSSSSSSSYKTSFALNLHRAYRHTYRCVASTNTAWDFNMCAICAHWFACRGYCIRLLAAVCAFNMFFVFVIMCSSCSQVGAAGCSVAGAS